MAGKTGKPRSEKPSAGKAAARLPLKDVFGYPSWTIANDDVEVSLAKRGGHMAPVTFFRNDAKWAPLSVAPWYDEKKAKYADKLLSLLRGDFFCMPFGGNAVPYGDEKHPGHGETANNDWRLTDAGEAVGDSEVVFMAAAMRTRIRKADVEKLVALRKGEQAVYILHEIGGMSGPMPYGHHAMLHWQRQGAGLISLSRFKFGQVYPGQFENPAEGGYGCLKPGATFTRLDKVPLAAGGYADLGVYPARLGFEDLVMVCSDGKGPFAWSAAVYPDDRMVWFALKDPKKLASTVLWHSNRGRHYSPWNGRHIGVLGIEEVTGYFHEGLAASAKPNPLSKKGISTCRNFRPDETFSIPYIMAAAKVPARFDHVATIEPVTEGKVRLVSRSGKKVDVKVDWDFVSYDG